MAGLSHNILANFGGRAWSMLIGVALVPVYLHLLGAEAYGLIGFYITLQNALGLLDLGLSLTLNRELARATARDINGSRVASLVRTVEILYWVLALASGLGVVLLAPWLAEHWIQSQTLGTGVVQRAVRAMGIVIALQAPLSLYTGGLLGLQRQVLVNVLIAGLATIRGVGALAILWLISATVDAYFYWQIVVAFLGTLGTAAVLWRFLPASAARFQLPLLRGIAPYAFSVSANALVGLCISQLDKLLLSHLLSLRQFGYYTLAGVVSSALYAIFGPVNSAIFPRFVQLWEIKDTARIAALYHKSCQLVAVLIFPIALLLMFFAYDCVLAWTGRADVAANTDRLVACLVLSAMLNGACSVGGYLLSACGRPDIMLKTNIATALFWIPGLLIAVPTYGALAAALLWIVIMVVQLVVVVSAINKLIIPGEFSRWLTKDLLAPLAACAAVIVLARAVVAEVDSRLLLWAALLATGALATGATFVAATEVRSRGIALGMAAWRRFQVAH